MRTEKLLYMGCLMAAQTYKGNYHLLCEVEGKKRKFVITNKKKEYSLIDKVGTDNLTEEQLYLLVKPFFVR